MSIGLIKLSGETTIKLDANESFKINNLETEISDIIGKKITITSLYRKSFCDFGIRPVYYEYDVYFNVVI